VGCNCGGNFKIDDGAEEVPVVGDASYFHNGPGITSDNAEGALVAPNGTPVWNPETQRTEEHF
jgi:hypothetical protein